jgi:hypothetical protein
VASEHSQEHAAQAERAKRLRARIHDLKSGTVTSESTDAPKSIKEQVDDRARQLDEQRPK